MHLDYRIQDKVARYNGKILDQNRNTWRHTANKNR